MKSLLVKLNEKSSTKTDFWGRNQKDMSHDGNTQVTHEIDGIFWPMVYFVPHCAMV